MNSSLLPSIYNHLHVQILSSDQSMHALKNLESLHFSLLDLPFVCFDGQQLLRRPRTPVFGERWIAPKRAEKLQYNVSFSKRVDRQELTYKKMIGEEEWFVYNISVHM